jgi:peptide-methionine (S)-S-oxide reductase
MDELHRLLADASPDEVQAAFGLAVMHGQLAAARACLDAGADIDAFLPVHKHATAMHQAARNGDMPMLKLLVERGASLHVRDKIWDGTPVGWAMHNGREAAVAYLKDAMSGDAA